MKEYRYFMSGGFVPENREYGDFLQIDVPSPCVHDSEAEAMQDECFGYRFGYRNNEVVVLVFAKESWCAGEENGEKYVETWVEGDPIYIYTWDEFKKNRGLIFLCDGYGEPQDIKATFAQLFPSLNEKAKPVYIDNEAYVVREVDS